MRRPKRKTGAAVALVGLSALGLVGCGSAADDGAGEIDPQAVEKALEEGGDLLFWGWGNALQPMVDKFMEEYPQVDIELVNVGTGADHYTALENAIQAGSGVPDLAVMEYMAIPQWALSERMLDLVPYGAEELDGTFSTGTWNSVHVDDGIYSLPMSSGPIAMFYNQAIFDEYGIEVPQTWDQYVQAARDLHKANPDSYLANDMGSANQTMSMFWQQGAQPFTSEGTNVTIDLESDAAMQYTDLWQQLIDEELLAPINTWSDEWYQGLSDGTIASITSGAWMPGNLESGVENGSGDWRVAPMPQWSTEGSVTAEDGGAAIGIPAASGNHELAYAFLEWATAGEGVDERLFDTFPATVAHLESAEFLDYKPEYFGGQAINEVLSQAAADVGENWSFLPYQTYANSIYPDHVGKAYTGQTTLAEGLKSWQEALVSYGNDQGFTVNK